MMMPPRPLDLLISITALLPWSIALMRLLAQGIDQQPRTVAAFLASVCSLVAVPHFVATVHPLFKMAMTLLAVASFARLFVNVPAAAAASVPPRS